ncbi:MAG: CoA transferase [Acidimicrobiia bacterium]|nr:CoA transferase [Acidimicrobiia bacterium]
MDRPLSDLVVLDLTRALAGPIAGRLLSDLGAEVIKVEPPEGDLTRSIVPRVDGMSAYFVQYNAGKRCVSMDLARPEGRELLLRLVERADIVLENYRPRVMDRLGLDFETLVARNPRIILASVSGWGHGNSRSGDGAFASAIHAEAGVTAMVAKRRLEDHEPRNDPISHADVYTGLHALGALLAAVHLRDRTGEAQAVEVSMAESMLVVNDLASCELTGEEPAHGFRPGQNWSPIFALSNGRHVNVTLDATTNAGFRTWWLAMGRPGLADDPRFADIVDRVRNRAALEGELAAWVATFDDAASLQGALGLSTVLVSDVRTTAELSRTDWAGERGAFVDVDTGRGEAVTVPQSPWRFRGAASGVKPVAGFRGQHNREVLRDMLGADDHEVDALIEEGILSDRPPTWRQE